MTEILSLLEEWEAQHERHAQALLGPSDVDRCLRQSAYVLHGVPPSDEEKSKQKAQFGSLLHLGWAEMIRALGKAHHQAEVKIEIPGLLRGGTSDDVDYQRRVVNDLKTASDRAWTRYVNHGLPERMWDQVEIYAYGLWLAEDEASGLVEMASSWTLAIALLNRESGQIAPFEQAADVVRGARLVERLAARQQVLMDSASPEEIPREGDGPDAGFPCDWCPFVSRCWPQPVGDLSPQAMTIAEDPYQIELALNAYLTAAGEASKAKKAQDAARVYLTGLEAKTYGSMTLGWRGGRTIDDEPDGDEAVRMLREMGIEPPTKTRKTAKQISVKRVVPRVGE